MHADADRAVDGMAGGSPFHAEGLLFLAVSTGWSAEPGPTTSLPTSPKSSEVGSFEAAAAALGRARDIDPPGVWVQAEGARGPRLLVIHRWRLDDAFVATRWHHVFHRAEPQRAQELLALARRFHRN